MAEARVVEERGVRRLTRGGRELIDVIVAASRIHRAAGVATIPAPGSSMTGGIVSDLRAALRSLARPKEGDDAASLEALRRGLAPFILRRTKQ